MKFKGPKSNCVAGIEGANGRSVEKKGPNRRTTRGVEKRGSKFEAVNAETENGRRKGECLCDSTLNSVLFIFNSWNLVYPYPKLTEIFPPFYLIPCSDNLTCVTLNDRPALVEFSFASMPTTSSEFPI